MPPKLCWVEHECSCPTTSVTVTHIVLNSGPFRAQWGRTSQSRAFCYAVVILLGATHVMKGSQQGALTPSEPLLMCVRTTETQEDLESGASTVSCMCLRRLVFALTDHHLFLDDTRMKAAVTKLCSFICPVPVSSMVPALVEGKT